MLDFIRFYKILLDFIRKIKSLFIREKIVRCCGSCTEFKMDDFSWGTCGDNFIVHVTDQPCKDYVMCEKNKLSDAYRFEYEDEC